MIYLDVFESPKLEELIAQTTDVVRVPLNEHGYADIYWQGIQGDTHQIENKDISEVLDNKDHVEWQLQKQYGKTTEHILMIRGIVFPTKDGVSGMRLIHTKRGPMYVLGHRYHTSYYAYRSWLEGLDKAGIRVVETPDIFSTANNIVAMHSYAQRTEHHTLQGYYRPPIVIAEHNPHVLALMGLSFAYDLKIGELKATTLIERFGTMMGVLNASEKDLTSVKGIGKVMARHLKEVTNE